MPVNRDARPPMSYATTLDVLRRTRGWMDAGTLRQMAKARERVYRSQRDTMWRNHAIEAVRTVRALRALAREKERAAAALVDPLEMADRYEQAASYLEGAAELMDPYISVVAMKDATHEYYIHPGMLLGAARTLRNGARARRGQPIVP